MKRFLAAAAAALLALPAFAQRPAAPIPVEALAELPFMSDPVLSPDGRRIAAQVTIGGKANIAVFDLPITADTKPKLVKANDLELRSYKWAGSDRLLIGVRTYVLIWGLPLPVTRLFGYELATGKSVRLGEGEGLVGDDVIFIDPDGKYILLSAQKSTLTPPSVERIDLATGASTTVQKSKPGVWNWFADPGGFVRAGVEYGKRQLKLYYRSTPTDELRRIDTQKYPKDDSVIDMIRFVGATDRGYVVTNAQTGRFAVYEYDFAADALGKAVFEHPKVDVTTMITGADGSLDAVVYDDDKPKVHWLKPELAKVQATIDGVLKGKTNLVSSKSRDGNILLIWSGGADDPGTYYVFNRAARRMEAVAKPYDKLADAKFSAVQPITYAARDGLQVPGYLTLPAGKSGKNLPLVVMPHGGPFARDSWTFNPWVQFLADRGYAVLQPNFRGSTGYGRDYAAKGVGQWGTGMANDVEDGVDWLVAQGIADPKRVCIMGASYGGYAALWGAIRSPQRYRCAISMAGVTDVRAMLKFDAKSGMPSRYFKDWKERVTGEEKSDLAAISPLQQAASLKVPVLIAHGEKDTNVPASQSRDLVNALTAAGRPVESVFYPNAGHNFSTTADSVDFLKRVEAFLAKHNPS